MEGNGGARKRNSLSEEDGEEGYGRTGDKMEGLGKGTGCFLTGCPNRADNSWHKWVNPACGL